MDDLRFDALVRSLARPAARRATLRLLAAGLVTASGLSEATAAKCVKLGKKCVKRGEKLKCCGGAICKDKCKCVGGKAPCRGKCIPRTRCCTANDCAAGESCKNGVCGCETAADCPGQDTECQTRTCRTRTCGLSFTPAGTPLAIQNGRRLPAAGLR